MLDLSIKNLYFHKDYDGVVAAAMVFENLSVPPQLHAVQYSPSLNWLSKNLGESPGIVDFLFHPTAKLWVDHHATSFLDESQKSNFQPDQYRVLDQSAPSCPYIIEKLPWFSLGENWVDYIKWSNIIDSAQYSTPAEANDISNPHLMLSRLIAEINDDSILGELIKAISRKSIKDVLAIKAIREINSRLVEREVKMREIFWRESRFHNGVGILDQSSFDVPYHRYIVYERFPHIHYGIGIYRTESNFIVSVGENPWNRCDAVDLGLLCKEFGGGGRKNTAGVPVISMEKSRSLARLISERLNDILDSR